MRRRLACWLCDVASHLLAAAHRIAPDAVVVIEELVDAESEVDSSDDKLVALAESRELAIGMAMLDLEHVTVHRGGPGCTGAAGCECGAVAYRADRGRA